MIELTFEATPRTLNGVRHYLVQGTNQGGTMALGIGSTLAEAFFAFITSAIRNWDRGF